MSRTPSLLLPAGPLLLALAACATTPPDPPVEPHPGAEAPWRLPAGWNEVEPLAFEQLALGELPEGVAVRLADGDLALLRATLDEMSPSSVRAAVLLARSGDPRAPDTLLDRLEERVEGPLRASDAADVVSAAALARGLPGATAARAGERLEALAVGPRPHPDPEVRVECAASALVLGQDAPIDWLLAVLRIATHDGQGDELDFEPSQTTAWMRSRAAESLSLRAGVPCTYSADAPIALREAEVRALEVALRD